MGLFDQMFGSGAAVQRQQRFNELKVKYQSVLNAMEHEQVKLQNLHVEDNKLFIKGTVSSEDARDKIWNQIKLVDTGSETDLSCDISVDQTRLAGGSW